MTDENHDEIPRAEELAALEDTRGRLWYAAWLEFREHGYTGTDTNRIARRASKSPQTFYRHFSNKLDIFGDIYRSWIAQNWYDIARAAASEEEAGPRAAAIARAAIES